MTEIRLIDFGQSFQIDEKYGVSVENNISDIRDLGSVTSQSSKSLFVESTEEINRLFQSVFNINIEQPLASNQKTEAQLVVDGEIIMEGFAQIVNVDYLGRYNYLYEIQIFDNQIDFFVDIEEQGLDDLDFEQWNHIYNLDNIEESFTKDVNELPYSYLLFENVDNDYWLTVEDFKPAFYAKALLDSIFWSKGYRYKSDFIESDYFKQIIIPYASGDNLPQITPQEVEDRTVRGVSDCEVEQSEFISSLLYEPNTPLLQPIDRVIHPIQTQTIGDPDLLQTQLCDEPTSNEETAHFIFKNSGSHNINAQFEYDIEIRNLTANTYSPAVNLPPINGFERDKIYMDVLLWKFTDDFPWSPIGVQNPTGATLVDQLSIEIEDVPSVGDNTTVNLDGVATYSFQNIEVQDGEKFFIQYKLRRFGFIEDGQISPQPTAGLETRYTIGGTANTFIFNEPIPIDVSEGDEIVLNNWLPQMKQREFLKNLTLMFNLKWAPSLEDPKEIIIEPRDDFYSKGEIKFLDGNDNFFVINDTSRYRVVSDLQAKEVLFTYENDDDNEETQTGKQILKDYTEEFKEVYGQQRIVFENENLRGVKEIKPTFSPTPTIEAGITQGNNYRRYISGAINAKFPKNNFRILFRNVLTGSEGWIGQNRAVKIFTDAIGAQPVTGEIFKRKYLNTYATATQYDDPNKPNFDLNFGRTRLIYTEPDNLTDGNLFNLFWSDEILSMNTQRMLIANFHISRQEYARLKMNTVLHFEKNQYSNYYIINKIVEYNCKSEKAKLELLTFDPTLSFRVAPISRPTDKKDVDLGRIRRTFYNNPDLNGTGVVIGNNNKGFINGGLIVGNDNDIQNPESVVIGSGITATQEGLNVNDVLIDGESVTKNIGQGVLKAKVTQSGTDDPVLTTFVDTIGVVSFVRLGQGEYQLNFNKDVLNQIMINFQFGEKFDLVFFSEGVDLIKIDTRSVTSGLLEDNILEGYLTITYFE